LRLGLGCLAVLALTAASLFRQAGVPSWRTVWAEDGVFVGDVQRRGFASLFDPFAGYLQVVGRSIPSIAQLLLPVRWWSIGFAFGGAFVTALLAAAAYCWSEDIIPPRILRATLAGDKR